MTILLKAQLKFIHNIYYFVKFYYYLHETYKKVMSLASFPFTKKQGKLYMNIVQMDALCVQLNQHDFQIYDIQIKREMMSLFQKCQNDSHVKLSSFDKFNDL